jgi:predicted permease
MQISGNYFRMLGTRPLIGRVILPEDDQAGAPPVAVISGNLWRKQFNAQSNILGFPLHLNGVVFTVIGVTPIDYAGTAHFVPDVWIPIEAETLLESKLSSFSGGERTDNASSLWGLVEGSLKPAMVLANSQAEMDVISAQLRASDQEMNRNARVIVDARRALFPLNGDMARFVALVMAAVALLLVIAGANFASLLLARATARHKEMALRLALGSGRQRLLRQLLSESALIGLLAGAIGLPMAWGTLRLLLAAVSPLLPSYGWGSTYAWGSINLPINPDIRIFGYTLLVSLTVGVLFGLAPALQALKTDLNSALKNEGGAFGQRMSHSRWLRIMIAAQIAACMVLLVNSALMLRGSHKALTGDPGFDAKHVLGVNFYGAAARYGHSRTQLEQIHREVIEAVAKLPGVKSLAESSSEPPLARVMPAGEDLPVMASAGNQWRDAGCTLVTPGYFETLRIPILRGRDFTPAEADARDHVVIISDNLARRLWPGQDPVGRRLAIGSKRSEEQNAEAQSLLAASSEVIGVARDVRSHLQDVDGPRLYRPLPPGRGWNSENTLLVRTEGQPAFLMPAIGDTVRRVDASLPVYGAVLNDRLSVDPDYVISRIAGVLSSAVGILGLLLACMGAYAMVSYSVGQRTREIGIRMALGARKAHVLGMLFREVTRPVFAGVATGIVASAAVSNVLSAVLFGLSPLDPVSFGSVPLLLGAVALVAAWFPARRAASVDPMEALRAGLRA